MSLKPTLIRLRFWTKRLSASTTRTRTQQENLNPKLLSRAWKENTVCSICFWNSIKPHWIVTHSKSSVRINLLESRTQNLLEMKRTPWCFRSRMSLLKSNMITRSLTRTCSWWSMLLCPTSSEIHLTPLLLRILRRKHCTRRLSRWFFKAKLMMFPKKNLRRSWINFPRDSMSRRVLQIWWSSWSKTC